MVQKSWRVDTQGSRPGGDHNPRGAIKITDLGLRPDSLNEFLKNKHFQHAPQVVPMCPDQHRGSGRPLAPTAAAAPAPA